MAKINVSKFIQLNPKLGKGVLPAIASQFKKTLN
jgi:hypothetical protein